MSLIIDGLVNEDLLLIYGTASRHIESGRNCTISLDKIEFLKAMGLLS